MNTRSTKTVPKQQPLQRILSSVTPSPHPHKKGPSPPSLTHEHHNRGRNHLQPTTVVVPTSTSATTTTPQEEKKEKARQYNKAYSEKLRRDGNFEEHKERVREYNAKRRQTLNTMAKENCLSVRKMELTLKETKRNTGVDLLSLAIYGERKDCGDATLHQAPIKVVNNTPVTSIPQLDLSNAAATPNQKSSACQALSAPPYQLPQLMPRLPLHTPSSSRTEEKKQLTAVIEKKVITPNTTSPTSSPLASLLLPPPPPSSASQLTPHLQPVKTKRQKKEKHNQHNRAYRDKLKADKRRYEEHKEKARQYNDKRRKKLRALAKETGLTMKEMEKTIKEAKIISALSMTASKEADTSTTPSATMKFHAPNLIVGRVSPHPPLLVAATKSLDILSDAASIVLSQAQKQLQHCISHTPLSPTRQCRTVSEDNLDDYSMEVYSS